MKINYRSKPVNIVQSSCLGGMDSNAAPPTSTTLLPAIRHQCRGFFCAEAWKPEQSLEGLSLALGTLQHVLTSPKMHAVPPPCANVMADFFYNSTQPFLAGPGLRSPRHRPNIRSKEVSVPRTSSTSQKDKLCDPGFWEEEPRGQVTHQSHPGNVWWTWECMGPINPSAATGLSNSHLDEMGVEISRRSLLSLPVISCW